MSALMFSGERIAARNGAWNFLLATSLREIELEQ